MQREALANDNQSNGGFNPGDVTWIKLRGSSWWPAQVADENAVSDSRKPRKKKSGELLVRLYGTYEYSYMDPDKSHLGFNTVLKRHKGSHMEIIKKALKQDLEESGNPTTRSAKAKGKISVAERVKRALEEQDRKKLKPNCLSHDVTPQKSGESARRLKVMQDLGLAAPSGSPYLKNGRTLTVVH